jgi:hypothetical protein
VYIAGGVITMGLIMGSAYLPVFHNLQLISTYEVRTALKYFAYIKIASVSELRTIMLYHM